MPGVTISAGYGAGGSVIAPQVARLLGIPLLDRAISSYVAEQLHVSVPEAESGAIRRSPADRFLTILAPLAEGARPPLHHGAVHAVYPSYRHALGVSPSLWVGWNDLGVTLHALGRAQDAIAALQHAAAVARGSYERSLSLGFLASQLSYLGRGAAALGLAFDVKLLESLVALPGLAVLAAGKRLFEGPVGTAGRDLVDAGAAIALSSGYQSVAVGNFSMQMSIALAVARLGLTPEEAWSAATINAAYAAGYGDITGSLEVGKQADLLILNVTDYREIPRQFGINHVAMVFRDGALVLNRTRWRAPAEQPARRMCSYFLGRP